MDLSTYAGLQSAVPEAMARTGDTDLSSYMPVAIALAEAEFNRVLGAQPVAQMEASANLTSTDGVATLPTDYQTWRKVQVVGSKPLELVDPNWAADYDPSASSGATPRYFTISGSSLKTFPLFTGTVGLDYYGKLPALSNTNTSNWLLATHPDVYFKQAMAEAYAYTAGPNDLPLAEMWGARAAKALAEVIRLDLSRRFTRAGSRVRGPTP